MMTLRNVYIVVHNQQVMTRKKANEFLYLMWENGEVHSNFTEDHSEYERAVELLMKGLDFEEEIREKVL